MTITTEQAMQNPAIADALRRQIAKDAAERLPAPAGVKAPRPIPRGSSSPLSFAVHGNPLSLNNLYRNLPGRGRVSTAEGRRWKRRVAAAAKAAGAVVLEGPVAVTMRVFFDSRRPDLDNAGKSSIDALKGVCWQDDRQVEELHMFKGLDRQMPRVEVTVSRAERGEGGK